LLAISWWALTRAPVMFTALSSALVQIVFHHSRNTLILLPAGRRWTHERGDYRTLCHVVFYICGILIQKLTLHFSCPWGTKAILSLAYVELCVEFAPVWPCFLKWSTRWSPSIKLVDFSEKKLGVKERSIGKTSKINCRKNAGIIGFNACLMLYAPVMKFFCIFFFYLA